MTQPSPQKPKGRILFAGQAYYNTWYLAQALREAGWRADVLNWDANEASQTHYHGEDFKFSYKNRLDFLKHLIFYFLALFRYDVFHFSNAYGLLVSPWIHNVVKRLGLPAYSEIRLLKWFGKKIVYSNNSCQDGVSQTAFRNWPGPEPACDSCNWRNVPSVCSDERNLAWGKIRNELAHYQCTIGGNRADYNDDPRVHEVPEFYCLDPDFWHPDLEIPSAYRLSYPQGTVKLFHAVGNYDIRTDRNRRNIKSTHIYLPIIERLQTAGYQVGLAFFSKIPNKELRFYQVQTDIFVDMLTFGWFGATAREGMMLGKPVICYLRPVWLESIRREIPEYVDELPIVSATPETVYDVLKDLIENPTKRKEIGCRSREFALKWHSAKAGARRLGEIYSELLQTG